MMWGEQLSLSGKIQKYAVRVKQGLFEIKWPKASVFLKMGIDLVGGSMRAFLYPLSASPTTENQIHMPLQRKGNLPKRRWVRIVARPSARRYQIIARRYLFPFWVGVNGHCWEMVEWGSRARMAWPRASSSVCKRHYRFGTFV